MTPDEKIQELNLILPEPIKLPPNIEMQFSWVRISGNRVFISGHIALNADGSISEVTGKVGGEVTVEQGYEAAKRCALNIISQAKQACNGDLNKIKSCIKLTGYVNSTEDFIDQPKVINGASELISAVFGENGKHVRAAISANSLPLGAAVEVDAIFELK